jgi:uncharacterized membrane protein
MATQMVIALFDDLAQAERAIRTLEEDGFDRRDISVVTKHEGEHAAVEQTPAAGRSDESLAEEEAITGATIGGISGLIAGLAAFAVPGVGPLLMIGPLATALGGVALGAAAGGIVGALVDAGVPQERARSYEERILQGDVVLSLHTNREGAKRAETALARMGAREVYRAS